MITLPKLVVSESDLTAASGLTGKTSDTGGTAQDFFALLAGAMSGKTAKDGKTPLTLADLQEASQKLPQGEAKTTLNKLLGQLQDDNAIKADVSTLSDAQSVLSALTPEVKNDVLKQLGKTPLTLADLQEASQKLPQGEAKATLSKLLGQLQDDNATKTDVSTLSDAQSVISALTPEVKNDVLKQLGKDMQKEDDKPSLNDEEMAGLSALMAMLPHVTNPTAAVPAGETVSVTGADRKDGPATLAGLMTTNAQTSPHGKTSGKEFALPHAVQGQTAAVTDDAPLNQATPLTMAAAAKADTDSNLSAATPTVNVAPVISNATATVNTHPVVTVNAQLGTPEWQQNVSQHITLFTRQGQQTAELKLHPENLGQVNITLKIDDNQAQIQMASPHSHVRAALEAAILTLRTQLADNGIQLAQSNVSSESFAGQQQQQSAFGQSSSQRSTEGGAFNADDEETLAVPASLQSQARGNGIVDIFA